MSKTNQYLYRSPLNFLDPYTKEDAHIFFGRENEIDDVFLLFEKTNLVVIYGPSGSGKSSVVQCGLVNRFFDWKPIEIRRNRNIIDSYFKAIEIEMDEKNRITKGLFPKEDCKKLRDTFDKLIVTTRDNKYPENDNPNLIELHEIVDRLYENLSIIPFFIFDQFEEMFIENHDPEELNNFSLLLALITKRVSYSNVVICVQTEFFSHLVKLEGHNPNILNYKCEIRDPNEANIKKIIRGTFEKFNINQLYDGTKNELAEDEKEILINEIIQRIEKVGLHLPFVQIYLDKLYVLDFINTYPDDIELLRTPEKIDPEKYSLEIKKEEIEKYGDIEDILMRYIDEVSNYVIKTNNHLQENKDHSEYAVIKFLKYFITKKDTRRSIKVEQKIRKNDSQKTYFVLEQPYQQEVIYKIWGDEITDVDETIGDIIGELLKARILKYRNEQIEFSQNFLVKVVKGAIVPEDIKDIYKREFNAAFETYEYEGESKSELLHQTKIRKFGPFITQILNADKDQKDQKTKFWERSKRRVKVKSLRRIAIIMFVALASGALVGYFLSNYFLEEQAKKDKIQAKKDRDRREIDQFKLDVKDSLTEAMRISETDVTTAFKKFSNAVKKIESKPDSILNKGEFAYEIQVYNNLIQNYNIEPFYTKKIELRVKGKRPKIIKTKHRKLDDNTIVLFAQTPNNLYSKRIAINEKEEDSIWNAATNAGTIIYSFEPYFDKNGSLRVLFSDDEGLYDIGYQFDRNNDLTTLLPYGDFKKIEHLDQINNNRFVGSRGKEILNLKIDNGNVVLLNKFDGISNNTELLDLKSFGKNSNVVSYILFEKNDDPELEFFNFYKYNADSIGFEAKPKLIFHHPNGSSISNSFKTDVKGKQILFEDDRQVYAINFNQFDKDSVNIVTKINSFHQQSIVSIDSKINNNKDYYLLGSSDKTASLFYDRDPKNEGNEKMIKKLRGHTDALINVSFIDGRDDLVLTTSEDANFVIWNISNIDNASGLFSDEKLFMRLKYNKDRKKLYAGFQRTAFNKGYLLELTDNLKEKSFDSKKLFKANKYKNYDSNSFDFANGFIYVGQRFGNKILKFDNNLNETVAYELEMDSLKPPMIFDLKIRGSSMAAISKEGIYYLSNLKYPSDSIKKQTIWNKNLNFNSVDIHPTKELIIATSNDKNLYYWNTKKKNFEILNGHIDKVRDACFSEDGNYMISVSWDNTAIIWKINEDNTIYKYSDQRIRSHNSDIEAVATAINEKNHLIIATGSSDNTVQLHGLDLNIPDQKLYRIPSNIQHAHSIRSITFGEDSSIIYSADSQGTIKKWNWKEFMDTIVEARTAN